MRDTSSLVRYRSTSPPSRSGYCPDVRNDAKVMQRRTFLKLGALVAPLSRLGFSFPSGKPDGSEEIVAVFRAR